MALIAHKGFTYNLGAYRGEVEKAVREMEQGEIVKRIWAHDFTVWSDSPDEITNRLDWLGIAADLLRETSRFDELLHTLLTEGYSDVLLLGMGGSSLAPEVFSKTFGGQGSKALHLEVLDSTDPGAVRHQTQRLDPARTVFIVATKSGGTAETLSFFKFFYNWVSEAIPEGQAGEHFIAITDPGSKLVEIAQQYRFRAIFENNPNIGGRYSALSYFGLVPAALSGVDVPLLLVRAQEMAAACKIEAPAENPGALLGAILGELAKAGRDKVTFFAPPEIASFSDWVEQLIAESTGKDGKGILPVAGETPGSADQYGDDRLFVSLQLEGKPFQEAALSALEAAGHPVVRLALQDRDDIGQQFILWEMATAIAGYRLGIHPFNQPNVEAAKILARKMVAAYQESGELPEGEHVPLNVNALKDFLAKASSGDYISIQAYLQPTKGTTELLQSLRLKLRNRTRLATTLGYGPRFLHSTGQLHKGDGGNGLFIQLTSEPREDLPIPDQAGGPASSINFGVLKLAQALGDYQALLEARPPRRVLRFHLEGDTNAQLRDILSEL